MSKPKQYPPGTGAITIKEVALILGISERTIAARVADGSVKAFKLGKLIRITRKTLESIMEGDVNGRDQDRESG